MATGTAAADLDGIHVVDADTHLTEPHDLWTSRAPKAWLDRVPQVREVDGRPMWTIDGKVFGMAVGAAVVLPDGSKSLGTDFMGLGIDEVHAGASTVEPRLAVMDALGIHAQIAYPNVVGFGGHRFAEIDDPTLKVMCATIFNDGMAEFQEASGQASSPWPSSPGGTWTPPSPRSPGPSRWDCEASTQTPIRRTRVSPTWPTGTGIHSGRHAPISACRSTSTSAPAPRR